MDWLLSRMGGDTQERRIYRPDVFNRQGVSIMDIPPSLEAALPGLFLTTAIGKALVVKGLLTKEDVLAQLSDLSEGLTGPSAEAVLDAKRAVIRW